MQSPRSNKLLPPGKSQNTGSQARKSRKLIGFDKQRSRSGSKLNPDSPDSKLSKNSSKTFTKKQVDFDSMYSRFMQHKNYNENHELGYSEKEIKQAVNFIFKKYDSNFDQLLDKTEVKKLIVSSLLHMGHKHTPTELEIKQFINAMDKNNDGKLSRDQLQKAFKRANRIQY